MRGLQAEQSCHGQHDSSAALSICRETQRLWAGTLHNVTCPWALNSHQHLPIATVITCTVVALRGAPSDVLMFPLSMQVVLIAGGHTLSLLVIPCSPVLDENWTVQCAGIVVEQPEPAVRDAVTCALQKKYNGTEPVITGMSHALRLSVP